MQTILEKIQKWDVIDNTRPEIVTAMQIIKKKNNTIAIKIIQLGINGDVYINIIGK